MQEFKRNFAAVKIEEQTYKILYELKQKQGIPITEAIRVAVINYYGKKNSK